jgi:hypothetical protein
MIYINNEEMTMRLMLDPNLMTTLRAMMIVYHMYPVGKMLIP